MSKPIQTKDQDQYASGFFCPTEANPTTKDATTSQQWGVFDALEDTCVLIYSESTVYIAIGDDPTATTASHPVPALSLYPCRIPPNKKLAAIGGTVTVSTVA